MTAPGCALSIPIPQVPIIQRPWDVGTDGELRADAVTKGIFSFDAGTGEWIAIGQTMSDFDLYIDPVAGDDLAAGDAANPLKTWQGCYKRLPPVINNFVAVYVSPGTLDMIYLLGLKFTYSGYIILFGGLQLATGIVGPNTGTCTSGTKKTFTMLGAGWAVNELRGKQWQIVAGTHQYYSGRIISNTADTVTVSGIMSVPFNNTDVFEIQEETVEVYEGTNTYSDSPLHVAEVAGSVIVYGFRFLNNQNLYQNYVADLSKVDGLWVFECSFYATHRAGAWARFTAWINRCPDIYFSSCSFISDDAISGSWSGLYFYGPNGDVEFGDCVENDYLEYYYGIVHTVWGSCTRIFRAGAPQFDVYRTVEYMQLLDSNIDFANVRPGFRIDGPQNWDVRRSEIWRAAGDGFWSDGHFAESAAVYLNNTQINACSQNGINLGMNSTIALYNVTTDPAFLNGRFGVRARTGTTISYTGSNSISGTLGEVNLGDNLTAVPHGTPATDVTHLTRMAPFGS